MKVEYENFDAWKATAKAAGYSVRLTTKTKSNCYYQAIKKPPNGGVFGYFNTAKGTDPNAKPTRATAPGGSLTLKDTE